MAKAYATDGDLTTLRSWTSSVAAAVRTHYLDIAEEMIDLDVWGTKASLGHLELASHFLALDQPSLAPAGIATGPVTSRKMGEIATSYGAASLPASDMSSAALARTKYGQTFLLLRDSLPSGPVALEVG